MLNPHYYRGEFEITLTTTSAYFCKHFLVKKKKRLLELETNPIQSPSEHCVYFLKCDTIPIQK